MSETLAATVRELTAAADTLAGTTDWLCAMDPGAEAFGAGGPGRLGEFGRDLYRQWQSALDARARESSAHADRLTEVASSVSQAAGGYAESDDLAGRSQPEVS